MTLVESWEDTDFSEWSPNPIKFLSRTNRRAYDGKYSLSINSGGIITSSQGDGLPEYPQSDTEYQIVLNEYFVKDAGAFRLVFNHIDDNNYYYVRVYSSYSVTFQVGKVIAGNKTTVKEVELSNASDEWLGMKIIVSPNSQDYTAKVYRGGWQEGDTADKTISATISDLSKSTTFGFYIFDYFLGSKSLLDDIHVINTSQGPAAPTNLTASNTDSIDLT